MTARICAKSRRDIAFLSLNLVLLQTPPSFSPTTFKRRLSIYLRNKSTWGKRARLNAGREKAL